MDDFAMVARRPGRTANQNLIGLVLNLFSSIWLGIGLAVLLFVYCSIGSGMPAVRQHPWLEMTEFEWFHWWPFNALVILFAAVMVIATIRRIPLRTMNLGVWMIHAGIVTLALGSYYYFGTKIEGDAPVFRRLVRIEAPGAEKPAELVVLPGNRTDVNAGGKRWLFTIQSTNSDWPILSDEHQGEKAYAVNIRVDPPEGEPFIRQLLAGYPQYTEDVIPGQGRAVKKLGKKLVNEDLKLSLDYHPTEYFHVMQTWALFVRRVGETQWHERPIEGLPRYHDRISSRDQVFADPHHFPELRSIDLPIPPGPEGDPLSSARVHATGYLRYAHLDRQWREGGDRLNPVLELSLLGTDDKFELLALDPARSRAANGNIQFNWVDDPAAISSLPIAARAMLTFSVPETGAKLEVPITPELMGADFQPIENTPFAYRITSLQDNLAIPGSDRPLSLAMIEIKTPEKVIRRWVADVPEKTRDMPDSGDPHSTAATPPDPRIETTYRPGMTAPLVFTGHPGGLHFAFNSPHGPPITRAVSPMETIQVLPGLALRVDSLVLRGVSEVKPFVVPPAARQRDAGETFAMLKLEVDTGRGVQSEWLRFNAYVFPNEQYAYGGRFAYTPARFRLADGSLVEAVFSRKRLPLPSPIAMEDFELDTHLGGYSGSASTIRNYISRLRFLHGGAWTEPEPIAVNHPTEHGGFWYFQSTWDRPRNDDPAGGMNYTGLGIGNRHGVYAQLAGCCLAVVGMIFAFYVKPVLKRRRAARQAEKYFGEDLIEERPAARRIPGEPVEV
jgi:hypothetical protein